MNIWNTIQLQGTSKNQISKFSIAAICSSTHWVSFPLMLKSSSSLKFSFIFSICLCFLPISLRCLVKRTSKVSPLNRFFVFSTFSFTILVFSSISFLSSIHCLFLCSVFHLFNNDERVLYSSDSTFVFFVKTLYYVN